VSKVASKLNNKINSKTSLKKNKKIQIKVKSKNKDKMKSTLKTKAKVRKKAQPFKDKELIVIDEAQGLIFENEKTLFGYFLNQIQYLENKYFKNFNSKIDYTNDELEAREKYLDSTLDDPDEIWIDAETFPNLTIYTLVKDFEIGDDVFSYVACVYLNSEEKYPTFVFVQFATRDAELLETFREKEIIYHRKLEAIQFAAIDGDSLLEGDYLAIGLLESMMKVRSDKDIAPDDFQKYAEYRDQVINEPDEIWRKVGSNGQVLVTFISDISENTISDLHYVVVTEEDQNTQVHSLLFSFPTIDDALLDRYRQGENLEAEEVSTESSH
jgi:phage-Barnase-EndoU-ColicinE5/D-RelE like nuclease2